MSSKLGIQYSAVREKDTAASLAAVALGPFTESLLIGMVVASVPRRLFWRAMSNRLLQLCCWEGGALYSNIEIRTMGQDLARKATQI